MVAERAHLGEFRRSLFQDPGGLVAVLRTILSAVRVFDFYLTLLSDTWTSSHRTCRRSVLMSLLRRFR